MEPKEFENLTPLEAAKRFHAANPYGSEKQALEFADIYFSENPELKEFATYWQQLSASAAKIRQAESKEMTERNWPDGKY